MNRTSGDLVGRRSPLGPRVAHELWLVVLAIVSVALIVTAGVRWSMLAIEVPLASAGLATALLWRYRPNWRLLRPRTKPQVSVRLPSGYRWLPAAWFIFLLIGSQKFGERDINAAPSGQLSLQNALELGFYLLVSAALVWKWLPKKRPGTNWLAVALLAWPLWALLSTSWSQIPLFTLVRSLQLFVPLALAVFTARVLDQTDVDERAFAGPFLRLFGNVSVALTVLAFVAPAPSTAQDGRLTWSGVHPLVAAEVWGGAALCLLVAGRAYLGMSLTGWCFRILVLSVGVIRADGRTAFVALLTAVAVAIWVRGRRQAIKRYLGLIFYLGLLISVAVLFARQLISFAERGQSADLLFNLDGRTGVWTTALAQLHTVKQTFIGFGLASSRAILPQYAAFAGHAHNSVVEALLDTGVVGLVLRTFALGLLAWRLRQQSLPQPLPTPLRAVLAALFWLLLVLSVGSPELATVGYSYTLVCFIAVFCLRARRDGLPLGHQHFGTRDSLRPLEPGYIASPRLAAAR